jgi:hypothetical protein
MGRGLQNTDTLIMKGCLLFEAIPYQKGVFIVTFI